MTDNQTQKKLEKMKRKYLRAKTAYYNDDGSELTDAEYDALEEGIRKRDPEWVELHKTGVEVANKKTEVKLMEFMPSLNKAYPQAIDKWLKNNPANFYTVTDKLDGSSLQLVYRQGELVQMVTRGNGVLGGDITFLARYLDFPKTIKRKSLTILRCEAVIPILRFQSKWANEFDNPRNMVNGLLNRKGAHPAMSDIKIVVLGVYHEYINRGLDLANMWGFCVVPSATLPIEEATPTFLMHHLSKRRRRSLFEMDGLVIVPDEFQLSYESADKPKDAVAFKVNLESESFETKVLKVIWQTSRFGRLIPKIQIEPTRIGGVLVSFCTAHNAKWLKDRKIGPGARVRIVRSGGVIPKIVDVTEPSSFSYPSKLARFDGVHLVTSSSSVASEVKVRQITTFLSTMGIEFIAGKTVDKALVHLPDALSYVAAWHQGKLKSILRVTTDSAITATKIVKEFDRVFSGRVSMKQLMIATAAFGPGMGDRKLSSLEKGGISMQDLTDTALWDKSLSKLEKKVTALPNWSDKTWSILRNGLPDWNRIYDDFTQFLTLDGSLPKTKPKKKGSLSGEFISFTGYRDQQHELSVVNAGAEVVAFGSKTSILLIKDGGKASSKVDKARSRGVKVATFAELGI